MTDKIFPTWINDRLPTEEDGNTNEPLVKYFPDSKQILEASFSDIKRGDYWFARGDLDENIIWTDCVATPQECLARAQGVGADEGTRKITSIEQELKEALAKSEERFRDMQEKKEMQALDLAEVEERVEELEEEKANPSLQMKFLATETRELKEQNKLLWGLLKMSMKERLGE